MQYNGIDGEA